jgi:hypothetical protein
MNNDITRILGGLYIAITAAMPKEAAEIADNVLLEFAEHPSVRPEDQRIYRLMALSANDPLDNFMDESAEPRSRFEVIQGGNSGA